MIAGLAKILCTPFLHLRNLTISQQSARGVQPFAETLLLCGSHSVRREQPTASLRSCLVSLTRQLALSV
jgi:hypothetical protein